jgi:hypothetical protein
MGSESAARRGACARSGRAVRGPECIGSGTRVWVQVLGSKCLGPSSVVLSFPVVPGGFAIRPMTLSAPAIARLGSDPGFSGLHIVMGCPWHDIRIVTDAGGHWRNISSELPASVSKWAKSYNLSRSLPPTGRPVSFKRPARYTRASSRRRPLVSRQPKMTILRPDFSLGKLFLQS